ncbi:MAG: DUF58 domain-containing protein, partial [Dehalococcoidia bacterium]
MLKAARRLYRFTRRNFTLLATATILVVSLVFAFASGFWVFFRFAYILLAAVPLSYLWARLNLARLHVRVERRADRAQVGQTTEERIEVRNLFPFPKIWLEVDDPSDLPGHNAKTAISLASQGRRSWRLTSQCRRRGLYTLGPLTITSGDPFGLFHLSRSYGRPHHLLVYPLPVDLSHFWVPPANLPGEGRFRRRTYYVTPNAASVRDYAPGDSFNRIHWPTTARLARLMVKTFELDPASDIWVVLDLDGRVQAGQGDESTEEYGVRIAASIVRYFIGANRSVGYIAYGQRLDILEPERSQDHYNQILEALALAQAVGDASLYQLLTAEERRFGRHTTLVVITSSTSESWVLALQS